MEKECYEVLHDKEGCISFKQYLKNACAGEVLNFWIEVELFKKIERPEEIISKAKFIFDKYLEFGTETEINVDEKSRVVVKKILDDGNVFDTTLFDKIQQQAFDLLSSDCFLGFKHSDIYKQHSERPKKPVKPRSGLSNVVHKTLTMRNNNRRQLTDSQKIMREYFDKLKHKEN